MRRMRGLDAGRSKKLQLGFGADGDAVGRHGRTGGGAVGGADDSQHRRVGALGGTVGRRFYRTHHRITFDAFTYVRSRAAHIRSDGLERCVSFAPHGGDAISVCPKTV